MPPLNLSWTIWGRPVKPVSLALSITMLVLFWSSAVNIGPTGDSPWGDVLGGMAVGTFLLLVLGWVRRSQSTNELGLAAAFYIWGIRVWLDALLDPMPLRNSGIYMAVCWMIVSGGAYLLERLDPSIPRGKGDTWTPQ